MKRLPFLLIGCVAALSCNPCGDVARSRATSPDGRLVANVFERNCGATTDFSSMVNVQSATDSFDGDQGLLFVARGTFNISVEWTGPRVLRIECPSCSRDKIFRQVAIDGDIVVNYAYPRDAQP